MLVVYIFGNLTHNKIYISTWFLDKYEDTPGYDVIIRFSTKQ